MGLRVTFRSEQTAPAELQYQRARIFGLIMEVALCKYGSV
jgi:hypothetical protein